MLVWKLSEMSGKRRVVNLWVNFTLMLSPNILYPLFACYLFAHSCYGSSHLLLLLPSSRRRQSSSMQSNSVEMTSGKNPRAPYSRAQQNFVTVHSHWIWIESQIVWLQYQGISELKRPSFYSPADCELRDWARLFYSLYQPKEGWLIGQKQPSVPVSITLWTGMFFHKLR